ncbi:hypothetical protein BDR03DRAFT_963050 [Suillus americanus]|nr:hypothetical protein BDR03DRAFT_963050 [Suillus americanus]
MLKCSGKSDEAYQPTSLPCYPFTVVYGHAAGRGLLDIKRWSTGLGTDCRSRRRLPAVVLDGSSFSSATYQLRDNKHARAPKSQEIDFGNNGQAHIVSVSCA